MFKTVDRIDGERLVICKVYGFDNRSTPVWSVPQNVNEAVYFPITGKFYCDLLAFAVFSVNFRYLSSDELLQKADGVLGYVIAVRYDISDFVHVVQVFD